MDALILARMQFAANMTFHILFPTISIALAWALLFIRLRWLKTSDEAWLTAYRFWTKVFALSFALGVVSGITMSFQFGTNWPGFMEKAGNVAGPLLGYEVLTAFFLEAGFLGIMLFGHGKVSEKWHLASTFFVAFGTTLSAFWILALDSWMQTPAGHTFVDGEFHVESWPAVIFNPSFPYRLVHMLLASTLTVAFLMAGVSAWQLVKRVGNPSTPKVLRLGLTIAALVIPVQIFVGDLHGLNTLHHQPQKIAAMEGVWQTEKGVPLLLFAWPNAAERRNDYAIAVPNVASWILTHRGRRRDQGAERIRGPPSAGRAGVLGLPHDGRHGHADARRELDRLVPVPARRLAARAAAAAAAVGTRRNDLLRLGRHRRRLVRDRDRPPALHRLRPAEDRRRGLERAVAA